MKHETQIRARLNELHRQYRIVSTDTINPTLAARIDELKMVLEDGDYIYDAGAIE